MGGFGLGLEGAVDLAGLGRVGAVPGEQPLGLPGDQRLGPGAVLDR